MKILHVADIHIILNKKNIPYEWQKNRFKLLFDKLLELEHTTDVTVLAGDIFDDIPDPDEICLFLNYANRVKNPTIAIPGNHEATTKGKSFLQHFTDKYVVNNNNFNLYTENTRVEIDNIGFQLFPYGEMQLGNVPKQVNPNDILITHIRGEVPPHISPEFDFEKLRNWNLILLGDLHFNHKYKDFPAYYSGSPLNTTFDRDDSRDYGVNIIDYTDKDKYSVKFNPLNLPKLVRKTISVDEELKEDPINHVIYEVTGSIDKLSKIKNHKLLDKKIANKPTEGAVLNLEGKKLVEELLEYLKFIKAENIDEIKQEFIKLNVEQ